jgi:hypothetical protein
LTIPSGWLVSIMGILRFWMGTIWRLPTASRDGINAALGSCQFDFLELTCHTPGELLGVLLPVKWGRSTGKSDQITLPPATYGDDGSNRMYGYKFKKRLAEQAA